MDGRFVMALDQGTTSSRAILFDHDSGVTAVAQKEFTQIYPKPGWVEHDPREIWASQEEVMHRALRQAGISADQLAAVGAQQHQGTTEHAQLVLQFVKHIRKHLLLPRLRRQQRTDRRENVEFSFMPIEVAVGWAAFRHACYHAVPVVEV